MGVGSPDYKEFFDYDYIVEEYKGRRCKEIMDMDENLEIKLRRSGNFEIQAVIDKIKQPLLIINGTDDRLEHYKYSFLNHVNKMIDYFQWADNTNEAMFVLLKGGKHSPPNNPQEEIFNCFTNLVSSWFQDTLKCRKNQRFH